MSNLQPSPYNNISGVPSSNAGLPYSSQYNPPAQHSVLRQDGNSNSPVPGFISPTNQGQTNHFNQSTNSSPAFNQTGIPSQSISGVNSSPMRPPIKPIISSSNQNIPASSANPNSISSSKSSPYHPKYQQQSHINDNAPPLVPSSQFNQPLNNGPPLPQMSHPSQQVTPSSAYSSVVNKPLVTSNSSLGPMHPSTAPPLFSPPSMPAGSLTSQPNAIYSAPSSSGAMRNSPQIPGPPMTGAVGPQRPIGSNGLTGNISGQSVGPPSNRGPMGSLPSGPTSLPPVSGFMKPNLGPPFQNQQLPGPLSNGPVGSSQTAGPPMTAHAYSGPSSLPTSQVPPQPQSLPHMGQSGIPQFGPPSGSFPGPPKTNIQNRYPQMPPSSYANHQPLQMAPQPIGKQYPPSSPYSPQGVTQQMGQLSVTKQGFDQLWGHQMVDLLQCRQIHPEYPEDPPEIRLGHQFADAPNCSPE